MWCGEPSQVQCTVRSVAHAQASVIRGILGMLLLLLFFFGCVIPSITITLLAIASTLTEATSDAIVPSGSLESRVCRLSLLLVASFRPLLCPYPTLVGGTFVIGVPYAAATGTGVIGVPYATARRYWNWRVQLFLIFNVVQYSQSSNRIMVLEYLKAS
jgi:hypothetical protein